MKYIYVCFTAENELHFNIYILVFERVYSIACTQSYILQIKSGRMTSAYEDQRGLDRPDVAKL